MKFLFASLLLIGSFAATAQRKAFSSIAIKDTPAPVLLVKGTDTVATFNPVRDTITINPAIVKFIRIGDGGKVASTEAIQRPLLALTQEFYTALLQALQTSQSPALTVSQLIAYIEEQLKAQAPTDPKK